MKRAEMLDARDVVRASCEAEQEKQRELTELLAMTQQELQQEQAATAEMERTTERLQRLHVNLSSAAPHLQHELDRVSVKDLHFDVHQVERTVQEEMDRQHELLQRLTQLEEDEWSRRLNRTERWIQTDPSRHFKLLKDELADGSRQRYVLGVEMGLMDNQWVTDKQQQMDDEERRAELAARRRRSGISLHSPTSSSSQLNSSREPSRSTHSHISPALAAFAASSSPALSGVLPPAAQTWASSLRSSSHAAGQPASQQPIRGRQRAGSVSVVHPNPSSTVPLEQSQQAVNQAGKARRGHARTQTMLPVGWQQTEAAELSNASTASSTHHRASIGTLTAAAHYDSPASIITEPFTASHSLTSASTAAGKRAVSPSLGVRNLTGRSINREQQSREREQAGSNDSEPRTVLSTLLDSSRRSARSPSPLLTDQLSTTQRSRSPLSPSRPRSAAEVVGEGGWQRSRRSSWLSSRDLRRVRWDGARMARPALSVDPPLLSPAVVPAPHRCSPACPAAVAVRAVSPLPADMSGRAAHSAAAVQSRPVRSWTLPV